VHLRPEAFRAADPEGRATALRLQHLLRLAAREVAMELEAPRSSSTDGEPEPLIGGGPEPWRL